jgi:1-deoxy-D-xylulose-5-phosphate synthase
MILEKIQNTDDLKMLRRELLPQLAYEVRQRIIDVTSTCGGHLAPSLGTVELTIALHYVYNSPRDKIIWDVGHQAYAHKILTGRNDSMNTIRQYKGLSGFTHIDESEHDIFSAGHASVSISQATGLVCGRDNQKQNYDVIAVIGDASLTGGMAFEGLNHLGHLNKDVTIIINDNEMSISKNVGALSKYLNSLITNPSYNRIKKQVDDSLHQIPMFGDLLFKGSNKIEEALKGLIVDGLLFEELGFRYFGPFDGHHIDDLVHTFTDLKQTKGPKVIHVITKKGKGFPLAEADPVRFHGTSPFNKETGEAEKKTIYKDIVKQKLVLLGQKDEKVCAITAAMEKGTGLDDFNKQFPDRFYDVGIAEQHAVTFSAGLAKSGMIPFVALYASFLQRAIDQLIHDAALQKLPVRLLIDRAGLVGDDGITHQGIYDIALVRSIPHVVLMSPRNGQEMVYMMNTAYEYAFGPIVMRYPKALVDMGQIDFHAIDTVEIGKAECLQEGTDITLIGFGPIFQLLEEAALALNESKIRCELIDARFAKPLDKELISRSVEKTGHVLTLEDHVICGGFGSVVLEALSEAGVSAKHKLMGLPDAFIEHGKVDELRHANHLTVEAIINNVKSLLKK